MERWILLLGSCSTLTMQQMAPNHQMRPSWGTELAYRTHECALGFPMPQRGGGGQLWGDEAFWGWSSTLDRRKDGVRVMEKGEAVGRLWWLAFLEWQLAGSCGDSVCVLTATVTGCLLNCCGFSKSKASILNCCKLPRAFLMFDKNTVNI